MLLPIPTARKQRHAHPISETSKSLHRHSIKRTTKPSVQTDSLAIIHLKLLKLRPHTLKIKKTLTAVINTSRAAPWLLRVAITFLTSLQQCQSTKKKKISVSKLLTVSKCLTIHSRYVLHVNCFTYMNSSLVSVQFAHYLSSLCHFFSKKEVHQTAII